MSMGNDLTVSGMVALLAEQTSSDEALFARIARSLINAGKLPKASGRAVPSVTLEERARFLLACMATDKPSEAVVALHDRWIAAGIRGAPHATAGEFLKENFELLADWNKEAISLWCYSRLDVERSYPSMTARFNENLAGFSNITVRQEKFVNKERTIAGPMSDGFTVTASCSGYALISLALGKPQFEWEPEAMSLFSDDPRFQPVH